MSRSHINTISECDYSIYTYCLEKMCKNKQQSHQTTHRAVKCSRSTSMFKSFNLLSDVEREYGNCAALRAWNMCSIMVQLSSPVKMSRSHYINCIHVPDVGAKTSQNSMCMRRELAAYLLSLFSYTFLRRGTFGVRTFEFLYIKSKIIIANKNVFLLIFDCVLLL